MEMIDFNAKKGFLCDMDGVIYHGNHILPGAAEFIHFCILLAGTVSNVAEVLRFPPVAPVIRCVSNDTSSVAACRRATFPSRGRLSTAAQTPQARRKASRGEGRGWLCYVFIQRCLLSAFSYCRRCRCGPR